MKDIRVEVPQQMPPQRKGLRLKPAGWLAVGVLAFFVLVLLAYAGQQIYWATHGIETLPTLPPVPTYTPAPTPVPPTPTPGPTPTPEGWSRGWDPVTKREYLVPPPEVGREVREAFNAVLAAVVVEDQSDEALRRYDLEEVHRRLAQYVLPEIADWYDSVPFVEIRPLAPEGPVQCSNYDTCTVTRAALEFRGYAIYDQKNCPEGYTAPCVVRTTETKFRVFSDAPYGRAFLAVVENREGKWVVVNWRVESLPQPPSSP